MDAAPAIEETRTIDDAGAVVATAAPEAIDAGGPWPCTFSGKPTCPFPRRRGDARPCTFTGDDAACSRLGRPIYLCGERTSADKTRSDPRSAPLPPWLARHKYRVLEIDGDGSDYGEFAFDAQTGMLIASWQDVGGVWDCRGPRAFVAPVIGTCDEVRCLDDRP
jgi:hypothetical protein